jgi:hypothetical protein
MTQPPTRSEPETSALGTLGWVGMVVVLSALALILLSWLGPLGEH